MNEKIIYKREHFQALPSTNDYLKEKRAAMQRGECEKRNYIVTADYQTSGRGTKGRSFLSEEGGVYLSMLTFYQNFKSKDVFLLLAQAAVAVCETLAYYGIESVIKWSNDIYVQDKKIAGILIENVFCGEGVSSSVIGIGLNVTNTLSSEIKNIATSMREAMGKTYDTEEVRERLIMELQKPRSMQEYLSYIGYMNREVTLILGDERVHGRLIFVDDSGRLHAEIDGEERCLSSAEVSISLRK